MSTIVTDDGQITIPQAYLDRLGLVPGSAVEFEVAADGRVVLSKAPSEPKRSRFDALRGSAGPGPTTDELMAMLRGEE